MDVKSTFLNGYLQEEVYVEQPVSFIVAGKEHKVLKLQKALYGLHQASRAWNAKLDDTLLSLGFQRTPSEHAIYIRRNSNVQLVVEVYIDYLVITGSDRDDIKSFKEEMASMFKMNDLSLLLHDEDFGEEWHDRMQSVSCTHGGPLEAKQAKHAAAGGRHSISEHRRKLVVFGEYSSRSCICCWLCE
jgi:hypothetical protein